MTVVLDASALLAYLKGESGADRVESLLGESVISSVNWSEVVQKAISVGIEVDVMRVNLRSAGLKIDSFTLEDGEKAAQLWTQMKERGLSLGDRACLSLGLRLNATVLTSDRAWKSIESTLDILVIR